MGSQMKSKYSGKCWKCGETWNSGDMMYYQKDPKAMCTDKECFEKHGGTVSDYKPFARKAVVEDTLDLEKIKGIADPAKKIVVIERMAQHEAFRHQIFVKTLKELGYTNPAVIGMLYNNACEDSRS